MLILRVTPGLSSEAPPPRGPLALSRACPRALTGRCSGLLAGGSPPSRLASGAPPGPCRLRVLRLGLLLARAPISNRPWPANHTRHLHFRPPSFVFVPSSRPRAQRRNLSSRFELTASGPWPWHAHHLAAGLLQTGPPVTAASTSVMRVRPPLPVERASAYSTTPMSPGHQCDRRRRPAPKENQYLHVACIGGPYNHGRGWPGCS